MSDLRPKGIPVTLLDGVERHFLFTLAVVDEVQDHYNLSVGEVMTKLADERESYQTLSFLTTALVNDEIRRTSTDGKPVEEAQIKELIDVPLAKEVVRAVMRSYGFSLPAAEEDEDPNPERSRSN